MLAIGCLFCTIAVSGSSRFYAKTILFGLGIILALIEIGINIYGKCHKTFFIGGIILFMAHLCLFFFQFQTSTLGDFMPEEYSIEAIEIRPKNSTDIFTWDIENGTIVNSTDGSNIAIKNCDIGEAANQIENLSLRNYWWPGAIKSDSVSDISIRVKNTSGITTISLYSQSQGIALYIRRNDEVQASHWLVYADIACILPQDVVSSILTL